MPWVPLRCDASKQRATFIGSALLRSVNAQQMFEITSVNSSLKTWQAELIYSSTPFSKQAVLSSHLEDFALGCKAVARCIRAYWLSQCEPAMSSQRVFIKAHYESWQRAGACMCAPASLNPGHRKTLPLTPIPKTRNHCYTISLSLSLSHRVTC